MQNPSPTIFFLYQNFSGQLPVGREDDNIPLNRLVYLQSTGSSSTSLHPTGSTETKVVLHRKNKLQDRFLKIISQI